MSAKLEEGTVFAGRYRVVRCLASGGMGAVYEAIHLDTNRRRALKVMHPHLFQSEEMRARFKLEARIAAEVDSEYIVDVSDAGVDEATQTPFLVMELLRGEELGDRLKRLGPLPADEVMTYMQQAAWALDRTHAASIVHRDLKPENLFLTTREDGTPRIKILDFGVAKLVAEGATAAGATRSLGTPLYMAPEQFRAGTRLAPSADIHALTLMTYTLLVGQAYWAEEARSAGDVIAFAMVVLRGPEESAVARAARRGVTLPPGFDAWFARGTAVNPAERFATASDAVRALRGIGSATASSAAAPLADSRPVMLADSRPAMPSGPMLERAVTSTGASAMTAAPVTPGRGPLFAGIAVVGLSMLGLGAWLASRPASSSQAASAASPAMSSAPAAMSATAMAKAPPVVAPSATPVVAASAIEIELEPPSKPVAPVAGGRKTVPTPTSTVKKPPPGPSLLGRD
jgi:serine/threonine-protein kinase